jgi:Ran GTPase-activating protein (RanGAP) involved in mRNA processing and transport
VGLEKIAFYSDLGAQVWRFDGTPLGPHGAGVLARSVNDHLCDLILARNGIASVGCRALALALGNATALQSLSITENRIMDAGIAALAVPLKSNNRLRVLDFRENGIGPSGAAAIAAALSHSFLRELSLFNNLIGDAGIIALAEAFKSNNAHLTLRDLNLGGNSISCAGAAAFSETMPSVASEVRRWPRR